MHTGHGVQVLARIARASRGADASAEFGDGIIANQSNEIATVADVFIQGWCAHACCARDARHRELLQALRFEDLPAFADYFEQ
jgi:hypothetical protein